MSVAPSLFTRDARIGLSPWSARSMNPDELARLEDRAASLGVVVSTFKRRHGFMVRVHGSTTTSLVGAGNLAAIIDGALSDYEEAQP